MFTSVEETLHTYNKKKTCSPKPVATASKFNVIKVLWGPQEDVDNTDSILLHTIPVPMLNEIVYNL